MNTIVVGISECQVAAPPDILTTYALGSCVGTCLLDPVTHVAGLSHIMLPSIGLSQNDGNLFKFADTALPELVRRMERRGAVRSRIFAKIAGGAQMFEITGQALANPMWHIGDRNVEAVLQTLQELGIPVTAQDVLKNYGRTLLFNPLTGAMTVKSIKKTIVL